MYDFNEQRTTSAVKNKAREISIADLIECYVAKYGEESVSVVGSNMVAVCLGTRTLSDGTEGEVCVEIKVTAKDFEDRIATSSGKRFKVYERIKEAEAYEDEVAKAQAKAAERERQNAEKKERDKAERERKKAERERQSE